MAKIFISYRRADTSGEAGRLYDRLRQTFGDAVFMDAGNIPLGADFSKIIDEHLKGTEIMLVVIGPSWLTATDADGKRRLDDANDFVRREVSAGLAREIATIPILVNDAKVPGETDLPIEISGLARRQGLQLYYDYYDASVDKLIEAIKQNIKWSDWENPRNLEEEIAKHYNNAFSISTQAYSLTILLNDARVQSTFWHSHVMKRVIVELIESADLSMWMKNEDTEIQPPEFWKDILIALAQSIFFNESYHVHDEASAKTILQETIEYMELDKIIVRFEEDEDDFEPPEFS